MGEQETLKHITDCHIAEFNNIWQEKLGFERRLYTLSAAYIGFFATISGFIAKIWIDPTSLAGIEATSEKFIFALFLVMTFINSLYNITASSVSWSILRLGLYLRDYLSPAVNSLYDLPAREDDTIWQWESLLRSKEYIGKHYNLLSRITLKHGETIFGIIIYLPSLLITPTVFWVISPKIWAMDDPWYIAALVFCYGLFMCSFILGLSLLASYAGTAKRVVPPRYLLKDDSQKSA